MPEKIVVQRKLWWVIAVSMLLLGINKQLDLQTLLTETGKVLAKRQGWYEERRQVQALFISGVLCGGLFALLLAWRALRNVWKECWLTIVGLVFLFSFVVIRAASFHHMDFFLSRYIVGFKINWVMELGGISCILVSAMINLRGHKISGDSANEYRDIYL